MDKIIKIAIAMLKNDEHDFNSADFDLRRVRSGSTTFFDINADGIWTREIAVWNTGRQYTEKGQRMAAIVAEGAKIVFVDVDRGVYYVTKSSWECMESLRTFVMQQYDGYDLCQTVPRELYHLVQPLKELAELV